MERHSFRIVWANLPKLCGNCACPQNSRTRKLGEITVFFAVFAGLPLNMRYNYHDSRHIREVNCLLKNTLVACVSYKIIYTSERFHFYTRLKLEPGHSNVFYEKIVLKNFEKFLRKTTMIGVIFK